MNHTSINQAFIGPIVSLNTLAINSGSTAMLDVLEKATLSIITRCITLGIEQILSILESVAVKSL